MEGVPIITAEREMTKDHSSIKGADTMTLQMKLTRFILVLIPTLFACSLQDRAFDTSAHHSLLRGTVSELSGDTVTLVTNEGKLSLELSPETEIKRDGVPSSRDGLKVGETIELEGRKLPGGSVAAREVWVHSGIKTVPSQEKEGR